MALSPGTLFGPYEIADEIGAGGMGVVYRATDTNLKRDVAIKVLPESLATDKERLARFQREAELLASLNHPNIAQIYGLEKADGTTALVMELVEGPTLADRIEQGALPADEALGIAMQIAEGLEGAHGQGIVHRDLKPANIKLRPDGTVKVLDFGIAKALAPDLLTSAPQSPMMTTPATMAGVILGTAAYMSPEQARGKQVDERADIWAFGCVLYEMLTGQPVFGGEDVTITLARVLERETDMDSLPASISPAVRHTIELCLQKDLRKRVADIRDVRLALEGAFETSAPSAAGTEAIESPRWSRQLPVAAAAVLVTALAVGLTAWSLWPVPDRPVTRFSVDLEGPLLAFQAIALSPDGRRIVYATNGQLYSRRMDQDEATVIPGTEDGSEPFFSPDGETVAFFTPTQLKAVGFTGEASRVLADIESAPGLVGAWDREGRIFFGQAGRYGLSWVPAVGGEPEPFADLADYEDLDYPDILPGGEWVLFTASTTEGEWSAAEVLAQNIATGEQKLVLEGGHFARYLSTGHLVFARGGTLHAVRFDPERVEALGSPVPLVQGVATNEQSGHAKFAVASNGTLVYEPGATTGVGEELAVIGVDRAGNTNALTTELRGYARPRLAPDGSRVAVEVSNAASAVHIWVMDLTTGGAVQLTFEGTENKYPVWTRDSRDVLFASDRDGTPAIYRKTADGTGQATPVMQGGEDPVPSDVLPGNILVYHDEGEGGSRDIFTLDLGGDGSATVFLASPANERSPRISPDGAWMLYISDESGSYRIYARPYPNTGGGQRAVPEGLGLAPTWSPDGEQIYFISVAPFTLMSAPVELTPTTITPGTPQVLFRYNFSFSALDQTAPYDVMTNGDGFVAVQLAGLLEAAGSRESSDTARLNIVLNWFEELERLVPTE